MAWRWLARTGWVLGLTVMATQGAYAQNGNVKKAEKFYGRYGGDDLVALAKAWDAIGDARAHNKTRDLPLTWVVAAEVSSAYALDANAQSPATDPGQDAVAAYMSAIDKDKEKVFTDRILKGALLLETRSQSQGTESYEARDYAAAWQHFQVALGAQKVVRQVGRPDEARERAALQFATLTAVKRNDLDAAKALHAELAAAYGVPVPTSLALASALADVKGPEEALALLEPLSDAKPDDAALLEGRIDLLLKLERPKAVVALLTQHEGMQGKAVGITLLHARSWDRVDDLARSAEAYEKAYDIDPQDQDVLRGYADVEMRRARAFEMVASATKSWKERKQARLDRDAANQNAMKLFRESRTLGPEHLPTLEMLRELYDEVNLRDREEISSLEQAIEAVREKQAAGADDEAGAPE